ncbi:MAG: IS66 family transposase [Planctomycetes bacterium]|nr:IS66 family transposase [Planctomycetota bacterium]
MANRDRPKPTTLEDALAIIETQDRELADVRAKLVALEQQFRRFLRRYAAPQSERLTDPGQTVIAEIADLATALASVPAPAPLTAIGSGDEKRRSKRDSSARGRGRTTLPDHLETTETRVELSEADRRMPDGSLLVPVGEERSERLDYIAGRFLRHVMVRVRYGERATRAPAVTAPIPPAIVPRGLATDRLVLHIAHQKYGLAMPLYRQRGEWLRLGVDLSTQTACSWLEHLSLRLMPIADAIRRQILTQPFLHLDETPVRLRRPGTGRCQQSRIWAYRGGRQVFYDFTPTREGRWPRAILGAYRGYIVADAYSGHDRLFEDAGGHAREVGCWAHARRPFHELRRRRPIADEILRLIQGLYRINDRADDLVAAQGGDLACERHRLRQQHAPPLLAAIRARCESICLSEPPRTDLAQGAVYVLAQWSALTRFLDAGYLPLDNNPVERDLRTVAIGRKNWLFFGSEDGGAWAAANFTIFQSCRLLGLDPIEYLTRVMPDLIDGRCDPLTLTPWSQAQAAIARCA